MGEAKSMLMGAATSARLAIVYGRQAAERAASTMLHNTLMTDFHYRRA